jgi:hypothetical protein
MSDRFDELVDTTGLSDAERERLRSVHELLIAAGPPPDLPAALREAPEPAGTVVELDSRRPRRRIVGGLIAAAIAVGCFGGGYLLGDQLASNDRWVVRVMPMEGVGVWQPAHASVSLGQAEGGNWPMELTVSGLPKQEGRGYYELFVWSHGKLGYPCVGFKMQQDTTTVRFTVPYEPKEDTELRMTVIAPGKAKWPGKIVMKTV